jgi:RNA recognition motif-containing protein
MGTRLYVGNVSYDTTEDTLRSVFSEDGRQVTDVHIVTDRDTGRPRGFAFVEMASAADASAAIEALDGQSVDGRPLRVNEAQERPQRRSGGGGGGGGYGGGGGRGGGGGGRRERW